MRRPAGHIFAVRTNMAWYLDGLDADREMNKLSTYLGHVRPKDTYWYIEAVAIIPSTELPTLFRQPDYSGN